MMYYFSKGHFPKEILQNFNTLTPMHSGLWKSPELHLYKQVSVLSHKLPQTISMKTSHCQRSIKTPNYQINGTHGFEHVIAIAIT